MNHNQRRLLDKVWKKKNQFCCEPLMGQDRSSGFVPLKCCQMVSCSQIHQLKDVSAILREKPLLTWEVSSQLSDACFLRRQWRTHCAPLLSKKAATKLNLHTNQTQTMCSNQPEGKTGIGCWGGGAQTILLSFENVYFDQNHCYKL